MTTPLSYVEYPVTIAGILQFNIPFQFLDTEHLTVTVDNVPVQFTASANGSVVTLAEAPEVGSTVRIERNTDATKALVDFNNVSLLNASDLDTSNNQLLFICQELKDKLPAEDSGGTVPDALFVSAFAEGVLATPSAIALRKMLGLGSTQVMRKVYLSDFGVVAGVATPGQAADTNTTALQNAVDYCATIATGSGRMVVLIIDIPYFYISNTILIPRSIILDGNGTRPEIRWWGGAAPMFRFTATDASENGARYLYLRGKANPDGTAATCGLWFDHMVNSPGTELDCIEGDAINGPLVSVDYCVSLTLQRFYPAYGTQIGVEVRTGRSDSSLHILDSNMDAPLNCVVDVKGTHGSINLDNVRIEGRPGEAYSVVKLTGGGQSTPVNFNHVHLSNNGTVTALVAVTGAADYAVPIRANGIRKDLNVTIEDIYADATYPTYNIAWPTDDYTGTDNGLSLEVNARRIIAGYAGIGIIPMAAGSTIGGIVFYDKDGLPKWKFRQDHGADGKLMVQSYDGSAWKTWMVFDRTVNSAGIAGLSIAANGTLQAAGQVSFPLDGSLPTYNIATNTAAQLVPVYTKTTTGDYATPFEGLHVKNTVDKTYKAYLGADWRTLATW